MKLTTFLTGAALGLCLNTHAGLYDFSYSSGAINQTIKDANLTGWSSTVDVSGLANQTTGVSVTLNLSGGFNGDLYAYISHGGVLVPLLNRVGVGTGSGAQYNFGYSTGSMSVTLADGNPNIHGVAAPQSQGTYAPDGRAISPLLLGADFAAANPTRTFADFAAAGSPNGLWTLFIADVSGGAESKLESWEIGITAVPEPVNVALAVFAAVGLTGVVIRKFVRKSA